MDPRPTLLVEDLDCPKTLLKKRKSAMRKHMKPAEGACAVVRKFREKQDRLWGRRNSDPDPFDDRYIFYCFTGKLEE